MIGTKLWKYRIEQLLGSGGFGTVYRAVDERDGAVSAIKVLPEDVDPDLLARFKRETSALLALNHPNIVRVRDVGIDGKTPYYVMDLIPGVTLREIMDQRVSRGEQTGSVETVRLATAVGGALEAIHRAGLVHRDIKPTNIMVTPDGRSVLMDFGLVKSRDLRHQTQAGQIVGTPLYMSPEQLRGEEAGAQSDLYSLGLVLYQMITGTLPTGDSQPFVAAHRRLSEPVPPPSKVNPAVGAGLEAIIMRMLELDLANRYASATDLIRDLAELSRDSERTLSISAPPPPARVLVGGSTGATGKTRQLPPEAVQRPDLVTGAEIVAGQSRPATAGEVTGDAQRAASGAPARPASSGTPAHGTDGLADSSSGPGVPGASSGAAPDFLQVAPTAPSSAALRAIEVLCVLLGIGVLALLAMATIPQAVRIGPREVQPRPGALVVRFKTDPAVSAEILFGEGDDLGQARVETDPPSQVHEILIEGLARNRAITYVVRVMFDGRLAKTSPETVRIP